MSFYIMRFGLDYIVTAKKPVYEPSCGLESCKVCPPVVADVVFSMCKSGFESLTGIKMKNKEYRKFSLRERK